MTKSALKTTVKLILGGCLIYYVLHSKMVDFEKLRDVIFNPWNLVLGFVFLACSFICCAVRWHLLVRAQGLSLSFKNLIGLTAIGNFFNTFMPGSVGGDLIKAWYVAGREPNRRTQAIFTVLLDRLIGLSVIVFYSATTLVFFPHWILGNPRLTAVAYTLWAFSAVSVLVALVFFTEAFWRFRVVNSMVSAACKWRRLQKIVDAALLYRNHLVQVAMAVSLSAISIFCITLFYKFQGDLLGIAMNLPQYFFAVPIALTISAIPILPGGIGVGQVAFFTLFKWMGMPNPEEGSTLCTLVQIYTILFNCLGVIFYLKMKRTLVPAQRPITEDAISKLSSQMAATTALHNA